MGILFRTVRNVRFLGYLEGKSGSEEQWMMTTVAIAATMRMMQVSLQVQEQGFETMNSHQCRLQHALKALDI